MARAMVINYGFSEIGPFSLLDPSAQGRAAPVVASAPAAAAAATPAAAIPATAAAHRSLLLCLLLCLPPSHPHPAEPQSQDMIMRMMARNSVSENLQKKIDNSVKQLATDAYDIALRHVRCVAHSLAASPCCGPPAGISSTGGWCWQTCMRVGRGQHRPCFLSV